MLDPAQYKANASSNSEANPRHPPARSWTSNSSSPLDSQSEDELSTSTPVAQLCDVIAVQADKVMRGRRDSATCSKTPGLRGCSPMNIRSDIKSRIEDTQRTLTFCPIHSCHHVTGTDRVILSQFVLDTLEGIVTSRNNELRASRLLRAELDEMLRKSEQTSASQIYRLNASRLRIRKLEKALDRTERERDTAFKAKKRAQKAEAELASDLDVARQEKANALVEIFLLQQALQLAQRGYHDTKEKVTMLRKNLRRAQENNDRLHQNTEALHAVLNANKVKMINLRKDHEFARTQSKAYLSAIQQSIQGHKTAKMQLLEQIGEERTLVAQRVAEVQRTNVELEEMLTVKMHATRHVSEGDVCIPMPSADTSDAAVKQEQGEGESSRWFATWRG